MATEKSRRPAKASAAAPSEKGDVDSMLTNLQGDLNKAFGQESAMRLDATQTLSKIPGWVSTRSMVVDAVLRGGRPMGSSLMPFGRQVEVSGPENSGKTTLCAQVAAEVQKEGGIVIVTDTEERIAHDYWQSLGVDTGRIIRLTATSLQEVFDKQYRALQFARDKCGDRKVLLIWDSLGGTSGVGMVDENSKLSPMEQAEKFGMRSAKVMSDGITLINEIIAKTHACYLYTNHEYTKIGVTYGSTRETKGGRKPKYFATARLQLTPCGLIKEVDAKTTLERTIGSKIRVKTLKNNMAGVLMDLEGVLMAHKGFVNEYTVFEYGVKTGVLSRSGSWTTWTTPSGEDIKFQGYTGFEEKVVTHAEYPTLELAVATLL